MILEPWRSPKGSKGFKAIEYVAFSGKLRSDCWVCTSHAPDSSGYPSTGRNGKPTRLHRYVYEKFVGSIPEGMCIMHKCDNKLCINPNHLEIGTIEKNTSDAWKRGLAHSKLSKQDVDFILKSKLNQTSLAEIFGVSQAAISLIRLGRNVARFKKEK